MGAFLVSFPLIAVSLMVIYVTGYTVRLVMHAAIPLLPAAASALTPGYDHVVQVWFITGAFDILLVAGFFIKRYISHRWLTPGDDYRTGPWYKSPAKPIHQLSAQLQRRSGRPPPAQDRRVFPEHARVVQGRPRAGFCARWGGIRGVCLARQRSARGRLGMRPFAVGSAGQEGRVRTDRLPPKVLLMLLVLLVSQRAREENSAVSSSTQTRRGRDRALGRASEKLTNVKYPTAAACAQRSDCHSLRLCTNCRRWHAVTPAT